MNTDLSPTTIALLVTLLLVQILFHTSKPTRGWIIARTSKAVAWTLDLVNRFLHVFLMSPVKAERGAAKDGQK